MLKKWKGAEHQSNACAARITIKAYIRSVDGARNCRTAYERRKPIVTSINVSRKNRFLLLSGLCVPVSQWGKTSAAMCERTAIGIARKGLLILAAITAPMIAWLVAVIWYLYTTMRY